MTNKQIAIIAGATAAIFSTVGGFLGYTIARTPPSPIVIELPSPIVIQLQKQHQ